MLSKEEFYNNVKDIAFDADRAVQEIITGPYRSKSGFYELCSAFATSANAYENNVEILVQKLKKQISQFCNRHHIVINSNLLNLINRSYIMLLPESTPVMRADYNALETGGLIGYFHYSPTLPSEIWDILLNDVDFLKEE